MPDGAVNTTYEFTATDVITSTKLNNVLDQSFMTSNAITGGTLEVVSGKLKVGTLTSSELGANCVNTDQIATNAVTTIKIADSTGASDGVTTVKLATGAVTAVKLANDAVETDKIKNNNVTAAKLSGAQTGAAPIFGIRAWVTFDMTRDSLNASNTNNTDRFIYDKGNVSSVTKTNTGEFEVNFATDMPSVNYAYSGSGLDTDGTGDVIIGRPLSGTKTASKIRLRSVNINGSATNFPEISLIFIG